MKYLIGMAVALFMGASAGAAMAQDWNSLAVDFEGAQGVIFNAATEADATQQALDACGNDNCQSIVTAQSPCLGFAYTDDQGGYYGYAHGQTALGSSTIALGYCYDSGYEGCEVQISQCVGDVPPPTSNKGPGPGKTKGLRD